MSQARDDLQNFYDRAIDLHVDSDDPEIKASLDALWALADYVSGLFDLME